MRKFLSAVLALITFIALVLSGCSDKDSVWEEMPENTNPNFKYFGYYHFSDAIDEVSAMGNANLAKVDAEDLDEIAHLYEKDFNILIMIRHIFFDSDGFTPENYLEEWTYAKTELAPYMNKIIGFYVDEAMWTGKDQTAFQLACQTVRNDYPYKRMFAMLAWGEVANSNILFGYNVAEYYKYCTDLGFDFYRTFVKEDVLEDIETFKTNAAIYGQDIWLSPKGFYVTDTSKNINWMLENKELEPGEDIIRWIKGAYEIAVADERIVGFLTFVYGNESTGEDYDIWLRRFFDENDPYYNEYMKKLYIEIGKAVIANDVYYL